MRQGDGDAATVILWRRLDQPGHDAARLTPEGQGWRVSGTALFVEKGLPCHLDYWVACDATWQTRAAGVTGHRGVEPVSVEIQVDVNQRWWLNGEERPNLTGCIDVDLSFTPATNLLPIRRLALPAGGGVEVVAAWLGFPELSLEPLSQRYVHTSAGAYRYESAGGAFVRELLVHASGFVLEYPGFWQVEAIAGDAHT